MTRTRSTSIRSVPLAIASLLALLALAACGGSSGDETAAAAGGSTEAAEAAEATSTEAESGAAEDDEIEATPVNTHKLPLGDDMYTTDGPKQGYVYSCISDFNGSGAFAQGPWIDAEAGTWNLSEKIHVWGEVEWESEFNEALEGGERELRGNGLPPQPSGIFPVEADDPAYEYDRNPNEIASYQLNASLPANPQQVDEPECVGGTIGVMRNGVPLYSPFDAGGRDAVATEIQDRCNAHPEVTGQYHYHGLSGCLYETDNEERSVLLGWALDGFGIYAERDADGTMLSSADLDVCHGRTSTVEWNGEERSMYHYVVTLDFPYTVACYRGEAISEAEGLNIGDPGGGGEPGGGPGGAGPPEQSPAG